MGIGRYEANTKGSSGDWYVHGENLQTAIKEISYPTLFYSLSFADNWCEELFDILPWPEGYKRDNWEHRQKVLGDNLHLAAWFYHKRISSFSKHMRNVLQCDWYWERVEAQFRTTLHTHGCTKMKNDHDIVNNTHLALIGFLAKEKLAHLHNGLQTEKDTPIIENSIFPEDEIKVATKRINSLFRELMEVFIDDRHKPHNDSTCYYVGIAFDQENENSEKVTSGAQEKETSKHQGMLNPQILKTITNLPPIDAYALESKIITFMKMQAEKYILNKSAVFGLGNRPKDWHKNNLKCTLTLLRGTYRHTRYRAYPELDKLYEDSLSNDELETQLNKLIVQGKEAEEKVCAFADYLISTYNPILKPDGSGDYLPKRAKDAPISSHPCAKCYTAWTETTKVKYQRDLDELINTCQTPHDCSKGGCRRIRKKTGQCECRFHFPRPREKCTRIEFKDHGKNPFGDILYRAHIFTKRNDPNINNYIPIFLSAWRANIDFQIIMDPVACAQYIAKYTAKAEKSSQKHNAFMKDILHNAKSDDRQLDIFRRMMLRGESLRDMGTPEIKFLNLGLSLVSTNIKFHSISLNGRRTLKYDDDDEFKRFRQKTSCASWKSIRDFYAERDLIEYDDQCRILILLYGNITIDSDTNIHTTEMNKHLLTILQRLNFNTFCIFFQESKNILSARTPVANDEHFVIRFWPAKKRYGHDANYREYCKYQLIRYKPWFDTPLDLCDEFMPLQIDEKNRTDIELQAYTEAYQTWLESDDCKFYIDKKKKERELEQAIVAQRIWKNNDEAPFESAKAQVPDPNLPIPDWMQMANFTKINECDDEFHTINRETPWHEAEQILVNRLHYLSAETYINEYILERTLKSPIEPVNCNLLTKDQRLPYYIILQHYHSNTTEALRMIIHGTAGTGKTFILKALKFILEDAILLTAYTGKAAALLNGNTTHNLLSLPVEYFDELSSTRADILQEKFAKYRDHPEKCYIIIDEMSLIGSGLLFWIDSRARQAFARPDKLFGGASIILVGDFAQLPPIDDCALFDPNTKKRWQDLGHSVYMKQFLTVIVLRENMRVNKSESEFMDILLRVRDGTTTIADHKFFSKRFISNVPKTVEFEKAIHLHFNKKPTNKRNSDMIHTLNKPIMTIKAENFPKAANSADIKTAKGGSPQLTLAVGAEIILTQNIWPEAGLINGTFGVIWEVLYDIDKGPPDLPIALLVKIPKFKGKSFIDGEDHIVPIIPNTYHFNFGQKSVACTRRQLPVMLAYALTIHKCQGSTLPKAVVDIGQYEPPAAPGLAFVALSRCKSINDYLFIDWPADRLNRMQNHIHFCKRMIEMNRLEVLFQHTRFNFNKTPMTTENIIDVTEYEDRILGKAKKKPTKMKKSKRKPLASIAPVRKRKRRKKAMSKKPVEQNVALDLFDDPIIPIIQKSSISKCRKRKASTNISTTTPKLKKFIILPMEDSFLFDDTDTTEIPRLRKRKTIATDLSSQDRNKLSRKTIKTRKPTTKLSNAFKRKRLI